MQYILYFYEMSQQLSGGITLKFGFHPFQRSFPVNFLPKRHYNLDIFDFSLGDLLLH